MKSLVVLLCAIFTLFYQTSAEISKCCCEKFSDEQGKQLRGLLQEEAISLRKGMQMMCPKKANKWQRVTNVTNPRKLVCFSAKGDNPGIFFIDREGFIAAFKLEYVKGQVSCDEDDCHSSISSYKSKWGCSARHPFVGSTPLGTFITTRTKRVLFPREKFLRDKSMPAWYALPGFEPDSQLLVFQDFSNPEFFQRGQELQLWYGEDLKNVNEMNNSGQTCVNVYVWYL